MTANQFQCTRRTNLLKLPNPYISLERCAKGHDQSEIDLLFNTIVLPNINYALSVYATSESDLTPVQCFLDRCFKRKYMSKTVSVYDFLERQDRDGSTLEPAVRSGDTGQPISCFDSCQLITTLMCN